MPLSYVTGTRPVTTYAAVTLISGSWTPLWTADTMRSFANVLGGTGGAGEVIYVTANPAALITDPTVAAIHTDVRGALYFETRGQNALYARMGSGSLVVRTSTAHQVAQTSPLGGFIAGRDYGIATSCGGGALTYVNSRYAPVLLLDPTRLRTTYFGDSNHIILAGKFDDPSVLALLTVTSFASSGPFFPGPLPIEGVDGVQFLDLGQGSQGHAWWISDNMVSL